MQPKTEMQQTPSRTEVGAEFKPVQEYIETCMSSLTKEAAIQIGQHGGYIDPLNETLTAKTLNYYSSRPFDSDLLLLSRNDPQSSIVYWYYSKPTSYCRNCMVTSQAPPFTDMEFQINRYLFLNLPFCINNLSLFTDQGLAFQIGSPQIQTTILENKIITEMMLPINLTKGSSTASITNFYSETQVPLGKIYAVAFNITINEIEHEYLEKVLGYILSTYSRLDSNYLPPYYAQTADYELYYWTQTAVKDKLNTLLNTYVPIFQVAGTKEYRAISESVPLSERNLFNSMTLDILEQNTQTSNMDISFVYPEKQLYSLVHPTSGELISAKVDEYPSPIPMISKKIVNTYQFYYDVSYPVVVQITDYSNPDEPYTFLFALEANIKDNRPLQLWWNESAQPIVWSKDLVQHVPANINTGETLTIPGSPIEYTYTPRQNTKNLFCTPEQQISGPITIKAMNANSRTYMSDVDITYGCGNYVSCGMGMTKYNATMHFALFKAQFPICQNGYLELTKPGYMKRTVKLSTLPGVPQDVGTIMMEPIITKNITVKKVMGYWNNSVATYDFNTTYPLFPNDMILISFEQILPDSSLDIPQTQTVVLGKDAIPNMTVDLIAGRYILSATLISYDGVYIFKNCKCAKKKSWYQGGGCDQWVPEQNINITPAMWGGVQFTTQNPYILSRSALTSLNDTLELVIVQFPYPRCIDDLSLMDKTATITASHRVALLPRFVSSSPENEIVLDEVTP